MGTYTGGGTKLYPLNLPKLWDSEDVYLEFSCGYYV